MQIKLRSILKTKVIIFMPRSLPEIASIQIAGFLDKKFLRFKLIKLTTIFFKSPIECFDRFSVKFF